MKTIRDLIDHGLLENCTGPPDGNRNKDWFRIGQLGKKVIVAECQRIESMLGEATTMGVHGVLVQT
jgi:hypothetical protein